MIIAMSAKGLALTLCGLSVTAAATMGTIVLTASSNADFSLAATPTSRTIEQGQSANYAVNVQGMNGFKDAVNLSVSNLPAGVTASFSPGVVIKPTDTSELSLTASASVPTGTYGGISLNGVSGNITRTQALTLTVISATTPKFSLAAGPAVVTMLPGDTASYNASITRAPGFTGSVNLTVSGVPANATATVSPQPGTGNASTLTVKTKNNTPNGNFTLTITATAAGAPTRSTTVALNLSATGKSFTISSPSFAGLAPGVSKQLNLTLSNPNNQPMLVTHLNVAVQAVEKAAGAVGQCTAGDYAVTQFAGTYPLEVPPGSVTLSALGVPAIQWPTVGMLNTSANQDGCKAAVMTLSLTGSGQG